MTNPNWTGDELRYHQLLTQSKYDPSVEPEPDVCVLSIEGRTIGSLGNFTGFKGKPKAGKTIFLAACLASAFIPGDIFGIKLIRPNNRPAIHWYDTEQAKYHHHKLMNTVKKYIGMDNLPRDISSFLLRKYPPEYLMPMIEVGIKSDPAVGIVVIDGGLDLCMDYNDVRESRGVINWLKAITEKYNILILIVIHQSKRDLHSLGHLGSGIDRWAESMLQIERDETKKFFTLSADMSRNPMADFTPITIMFDGEDFHKADVDIKSKTQKVSKPPQDFQITEHKYMISKVVLDGPEDKPCMYDDIVNDLCQLKGFSKVLSKKFISYWVEQEFIYRDSEKHYHRSKDTKLFISLN